MKKGFIFYYLGSMTLFAVITPNLQLFLESRGFNYTEIGFLQGLYQLVGVAGPLFIGSLADRSGRYRTLLILNYLVMIPLFLLLGLDHPLGLTAIWISIFGIALKSVVPLGDTLLSHSLENPEEDYGKYRIWGSIGFLACTIFMDYSGVFSRDFSRRFIGLMMLGALITLFTVFLLPDSGDNRKRQEEGKSNPEARLPLVFWLTMLTLFFAWMANSAYFSFYSLFLREETPITRVNIQWGLGALFEMPMIFFSGWIIRRWGIRKPLIFSLLVLSLRLGLYAFVRDPVILTLSQLLHAVTFGLLHVLAIAGVNRFAPPARKAAAMAIYFAVIRGAATFLGSTLGGWLSETGGFSRLFWVNALIPLPIALLLCIIPLRKLEYKRKGVSDEKILVSDPVSPSTFTDSPG